MLNDPQQDISSDPSPRPASGILESLPLVEHLTQSDRPTVGMFAAAAGSYIRLSDSLDYLILPDGRVVSPADQRKTAQMRMSKSLARAFCCDLKALSPDVKVDFGEIAIPGGLRKSKVDIASIDDQGAVRLAGEIKPVYLSVGRATPNRTKDVVYHSLNCHLADLRTIAFGAMVLPLWERSGDRKKSCVGQIRDAASALSKASGRSSVNDQPHLSEAMSLIVVCPDSGELVRDDMVPASLDWGSAVSRVSTLLAERFTDQISDK